MKTRKETLEEIANIIPPYEKIREPDWRGEDDDYDSDIWEAGYNFGLNRARKQILQAIRSIIKYEDEASK